MNDPDADDPPLPHERAAPAFVRTGCIVVCGLAALPILYVVSFALLLADSLYEGPVLRSLDEQVLEFLEYVYWPLIVLYEAFL